jgi:hypothetical protein
MKNYKLTYVKTLFNSGLREYCKGEKIEFKYRDTEPEFNVIDTFSLPDIFTSCAILDEGQAIILKFKFPKIKLKEIENDYPI